MLAEVMAIGDELVSGQRLDTNSQWLSQQLGELGMPVRFHSTVADDLDAHIAVLRTAIDRADLVVSTGGLGPTADDLTRQALARAAGVELVCDEDSLTTIRGMFARWKRPMPERNELQAMLPTGSSALPNHKGTAPGIAMTFERSGRGACHVFALPGVPAEMYPMWRDAAAPAIRALLPEQCVIKHRRINCFGAGESHIEQMLPDLIERGRRPTVGITASQATISLRITAEAESEQACDELIEPTAKLIYDRLGMLIFGEQDVQLHDAVCRLLHDRQARVATAETATTGLLTSWLSETSLASSVFAGGVVLSDAGAIENWIGTGSSLSPVNTTKSLAAVCRQRAGADFGLAIGPVVESDDVDRDDREVTVAMASGDGEITRQVELFGQSTLGKNRAAKQALNMLRLALLESD